MPQRSNQIQTQAQQQIQTLSPQQIMVVKLLEMTKQEFEERIHAELLDNPALETRNESPENENEEDYGNDRDDSGDEESYNSSDKDLSSGDYSSEDDIPDYVLQEQNRNRGERAEDIPFSDTDSFYDELRDQVAMQDFSDKEKALAEYLIGSLDNDGFLRKSLSTLADELAIYQGIDTSEAELQRILSIIQTFDPAGIGARDLQECLLLQLKRRPESPVKKDAQAIVEKCIDDFRKNNKERIMQRLSLTEEAYSQAMAELTRLNPRPGSALGEVIGKNFHQIIPDFIVETDDYGNITVSLNNWDVPSLRLSRDYITLLDEYTNNKDNQSKENKTAFSYYKQKVDAAQSFINAVKQRQHTLMVTMQAIVELQRPFFLDGDESSLRPMILKDVAELAKLDISTVSRVSSSKYAQTNFGVFPLKFFFSTGYKAKEADDQEMSTREIKRILQDLVDKEDKASPLTDDELAEILKGKGFPIARRTVAKYRLQLNIPVARLRRK